MAKYLTNVARRGFLRTASGAALGASALQVGSLRAAVEKGNPSRKGRLVETGARGMIPYRKVGEPMEVRGKRMIFTNYHYIRPASFGWYDDQGKSIAVKGTAGLYDAHFQSREVPYGIRIVAQPAERSLQPVAPLERTKPWERDGVSLGQILYDERDEYYKTWGTCTSEGKSHRCYLQSKDFESWERPELGVIGFDGNKRNNLIDLPEFRLHIFRDPSSSEEPWKWFAGEIPITRREYEDFQKRRPHNWDPKADRVDAYTETHIGASNLILGIKGGASPDGFRWKTLPELLSIEHADTINTCYYDIRLRKYVAYVRHWVMGDYSSEAPNDDRGLSWMAGRRAIGRSETDDFRNFPLSECILAPGPENIGASDTLYTNCHTLVPSAPDQHLFFPTIWHQHNDSTSLAVASSVDGKMVHWLPGNPILTTAPFGEWDGGCLFASGELLELPGGHWILPYHANNVPHKYPRKGAIKGGAGYATWKKGRLIGVEAAEVGQFSTFTFMPPGRKLRINALSVRGGSIRVEIADHQKKIVPGRSFDDCHPIVGDQHRSLVTWKGGNDLGVPEGRPILLRFRLDQAKLFCLDFV